MKSSRVDLTPVSARVVSPKEFIEIKNNQPLEIKTVKFISPKIGAKGFGSFAIEFKTPKLMPTK